MPKISKRFDELGADGSPRRLGFMGGTFDPIHMGHLRIAEEVREALALDAVLFIPTGNPVFKRGQQVTDASIRLNQVVRAIADNPHFDVSSIEIDRAGDTFTVDTLHELRAHYPDNVEIFFIVGSDAAQTIGKWRSSFEIAKLAHLAVAAGRPGYADAETLKSSIQAAGPFDVHIVEVSSLEISSSDIRERVDKGKSVRYLVPSCVEPEIRKLAGKSGMPGRTRPSGGKSASQEDALSDAFYEARREELKTRVSPKRFKHSLGVAEACMMLARQYGLDVGKARLAGILHDWDKGLDNDQARLRVEQLGMQDEVDPYVVEHMPGVLHGITAAYALAGEYPCIPGDVVQAISRHTTAAIDMSPLDMALYIADAIEPNRQFGRIDDLRSLVGQVSLEELYYQTYEYWVFLLFEKRKPLHPDTITIWNAYAERLQHAGMRGSGDGSISRGKHANAKKGKRKK